MLLTMEQAYKDAVMPMPNEERIDKVGGQAANVRIFASTPFTCTICTFSLS